MVKAFFIEVIDEVSNDFFVDTFFVVVVEFAVNEIEYHENRFHTEVANEMDNRNKSNKFKIKR